MSYLNPDGTSVATTPQRVGKMNTYSNNAIAGQAFDNSGFKPLTQFLSSSVTSVGVKTSVSQSMTVNYAGSYLVQAQMSVSASAGTYTVAFHKNGTELVTSETQMTTAAAEGTPIPVSMFDFQQFAQGDVVDVRVLGSVSGTFKVVEANFMVVAIPSAMVW